MLKFALIPLMGALLGACSSEKPGPQEPGLPADGVYLTMTLSVPRQAPVSRADGADSWDDPYDSEDATAREEAIDPASLTVVLRQGANSVVLTPGEGDEDLKAYMFKDEFLVVCALDGLFDRGALTADSEYDVEVYANNPLATVDASDTDALTFSRNNINGENLLPMFGFKRGVAALSANSVNDVGTIDLLRAVAKIDVRLSAEAAEKFEYVKAPELVNGNALIPATGYQTPLRANWSATTETRLLSFEQSMRPAAASAANGNIAFPNTVTNGYTIYIPEAANATGNDLHIGIDVSLRRKDDPTKLCTGRLYFTDYDPDTHRPVEGHDPKVFSLTRNHNYKFTILDAPDDIELRYEVINLTEVIIDVPSFD